MEKIVLELPIYTFQIDFSRHVSNIIYIQWMEMARLRLLEEGGLAAHHAASEHGIVPVLTTTEISYRMPLYLGDTVRVEAWLSELKRVSACIELRIYRGDGALAATGRQRGLFVSLETQRPHRLPPALRSGFERFLEAGEMDSPEAEQENDGRSAK